MKKMSYDSYNISVEDEDDPYIRKLDELEEEHSGSDSGSSTDNNNIFLNDAEKTQSMKNELEIVSLYLKCKKGVFKRACRQYKTYSDMLFIVSLLFSGSLVILPFFSVEKVAFSSLSLFTMFCIFFKNYYNFDISSNYFDNVSLRYGKIQLNAETFLLKLVYFQNKIEKQTAFYEKMREIENKLQDFKEENVSIPTSIQTMVPTISNINIFTSIHSVEMNQRTLKTRYKNVKTEIEKLKTKNSSEEKDKNRMRFLCTNKKKIKDELNNPDYSIIKEPLERESALIT